MSEHSCEKPSLRLRLLGAFECLDQDGAAVRLPSRKAEALVSRLATQPGRPLSRSLLSGLLWSESSEERARASLRQCLSTVRKTLDSFVSPTIRSTRLSISLDIPDTDVDVRVFERLAHASRVDDLARAVEWYRGDFLEGLALDDPVGEEWLIGERERLRELAVSALSRLLGDGKPRLDPGSIIGLANRLLCIDPFQEVAYRALMHAHASRGERSAAVLAYRTCRDTLAEELAVDPDDMTVRAYQSIVSQNRSAKR